MSRSDNLYELPKNLPIPVDDGACAHLTGMRVRHVRLPSTQGRDVCLAALSETVRVVVFCYPRTGEPDHDPPPGWDAIPGARGCTSQSCAFRDSHAEFQQLGVLVFGLSTQTTEYQAEMAARLALPFAVLSDAGLAFTKALRLPTFEIESMTLLKRVTLVLHRGKVETVFYPVFPPDRNAAEVLAWLRRG